MNSNPVCQFRGCLVLAALMLCATLPAMAAEAEPAATNPREESWQIEQRQRWVEESRGLRQVRDASRLRADAVAELKLQREMLDPARQASGENWQEIGPSSMNMVDWIMGRVAGRVNAIAVLPGTESTVYVGSAAGGVWKTTNAGISWAPIFDQVGTLPIGAITIDPTTPSTVWAGTGDKNGGACAGYFGNGVYVSEDSGATWNARNGSGPSAMPLSVVNAVAVQPTNSNVILVGGAGTCNAAGNLSGAGVYRSADHGLTWTKVINANVEDLVFVPGSSTVYAGVINSGVQKSTDGGATWVPANTGITITGPRMRLAMAPSNSNILYALVGNNVYRTVDGGVSWVLRSSSACEGQCGYNQTINVHPTNPDTLLIGTIRAARSINGGTSFTPLTSSWGTQQKVHQDTHVVLYSRTDPNRFWIGSDGGIWRSDDNGSSFLNMNANINITQFYDIAVDPNDSNIVFGGAQDNSSSSRRTNLLWNLTYASGDGFMNAIDQNNSSIVFQTSYPSGGFPSIVRSLQGGSAGSFNSMPTTGLTPTSQFPWVTPLAVAGSQLFVASDVLYRTTTTGTAWTAISPDMGIAAVVVTPEMHGTLMPTYVGTSGGLVYASADAGVPTPVFANVTGNYSGGRISDVAMDPADAQRVFITRAGFGFSRLYRSTVGGNTWIAVGANLPDVPANAVAIDPLNTLRVFVGTDIGVYESTDGGDTFVPFSAGLPLGIVVSDLEIDNIPHALTAGSYSRGAWRVFLAGSGGNAQPTADFDAASVGLNVTFSDRSVDNDGSIVTYSWDFGDGSPTSTATNPSHAYPSPGNYTVALTVTDNGGLTGSYAKVLRFSAPPVPLSNGIVLTNQHTAQGNELLYTLDVPAGATNLSFVTSGNVPGQDADLTVRLGAEFICESAGATEAERCDIPAPLAGTYTAVVYAYSELTNFSIVGSFTAPIDLIFANGFD